MPLGKNLGIDKTLVVKFEQIFIKLEMSFKIPLERLYPVNNKMKNQFWLNSYGIRKMVTINPMEKQIIERNTTSDNVSFLIDNKKCLCQHEKLHSLTPRNGK